MKGKSVAKLAEEYYDSVDANEFYQVIVGRERLHIGIYKDEKDSIKSAGINTLKRMVRLVPKMKKSTKVLELGSGYGGTARFLVEKYGCKVTCINISEVQNDIHHEKNKKLEMDEKITVTKGNFEKIPFPRESFDIVWSNDALLHSTHKDRVFSEVSRVLDSGGRFIFTDIIRSATATEEQVKPYMNTSVFKELGSFKKYDRLARRVDLEKVYNKELPEMAVKHYKKILDEIQSNKKKLSKAVSKKFLKDRIERYESLLAGIEAGVLSWAILHYQKRNTWM